MTTRDRKMRDVLRSIEGQLDGLRQLAHERADESGDTLDRRIEQEVEQARVHVENALDTNRRKIEAG